MTISEYRKRDSGVSLFLESITHIASERIASSVPITDIDSAMVACDMAEESGEDMREMAYFLQLAKRAASLVTQVQYYPAETTQYADRTMLVAETVVIRSPFLVIAFSPDSCLLELSKSLHRLGVSSESSLDGGGPVVISLPYPWQRVDFEMRF